MSIDFNDVDRAQIRIGRTLTHAKPSDRPGEAGEAPVPPPPPERPNVPVAAPSLAVKPRSYNFTRAARPSIPTSDMLTGLEIRLSDIRIIENGVTAFGPFGKTANLYLLSISVDDLGGGPQAVTVKGFPGVRDDEHLLVNSSAYYWKAVKRDDRTPGQIRLLATIIKSREGIRDIGNALVQLQKRDDYQNIVKNILSAAAPGAPAVEQALFSIANLVGTVMGRIEDKPLYTTSLSFTDIHGDFDQLGEHRTVHTTDKAEVAVSLTVRDMGRATD
jgi:hypothetical protein